jgi:hypothetical protein
MKNNLIEAIQTNWVSFLVSVVALGILYVLARRKVSFGTRVLISLGLGLVAGIVFNQLQLATDAVNTIGRIFVNLIRMIVIPLVLVSVIASIMTISSPGQLRKIGVKTIGLFLVTTGIAAIFGLIVALLINPGAGIEQSTPANFSAREIPTFWQVILDLTPTNAFGDMAAGSVVPVIIFGFFVAVAIVQLSSRNPETVQPFRNFIDSALQIMYQVTKYIIRLTPYGVYALIAVMAARYGAETLMPLIKVVIVTYIALILHTVITFGGMVSLLAKVNPIKFFKKIYPMVVVAFTTRSSFASLPIHIEVLNKRVRISPKITSFVAPLGATMNFNGCGGVWPAVVAVFVAEVFGIQLGITDYIILVLVAMISSIGVAGVPGPAAISTTVVLTALGLPLEGLGLVLAIEALVDMGRTAVNMMGDSVTALVVAESEGEFDREAFNNDLEDELELNPA